MVFTAECSHGTFRGCGPPFKNRYDMGQCCQRWYNCTILVKFKHGKYNGTLMSNLVEFQIIPDLCDKIT